MVLSIWQSFNRLPLWVRGWMALILMPANLATLAFLNAPLGNIIAFLAVGGMALNMPILLIERGFSKLLAAPHILAWSPLCGFIAWMLWSNANDGLMLPEQYIQFLIALLVVNLVSLAFDIPDTFKWVNGDRAIA